MTEQSPLEEAPIPVELCNCAKCRINRFRTKQAMGYLPVKPESRIVGKHEYLRLDGVNEEYFTKIKHEFEPDPIVEFGTCKVCDFKVSKEEFENYTIPFCKVFTQPSTLDTKLTELKAAGRKVLSTTREWGGWTIKMMVPKA
jgi:hypothetical protein